MASTWYLSSQQQAFFGTKGVARIGAKGAIWHSLRPLWFVAVFTEKWFDFPGNEISENFQVMVAVHELGHNLGSQACKQQIFRAWK